MSTLEAPVKEKTADDRRGRTMHILNHLSGRGWCGAPGPTKGTYSWAEGMRRGRLCVVCDDLERNALWMETLR